MSRDRQIHAIVQGIVASDTTVKQELGRRFAYCLGLTPGSLGGDGGIDGSGTFGDLNIYFQSKLSRHLLDASFAADLIGNLVIHEADIGVMLAGIGYTDGFYDRAQKALKSNKWKINCQIHLLTLEDIFSKNQNFLETIQHLPPLQSLSREAWKVYESS